MAFFLLESVYNGVKVVFSLPSQRWQIINDAQKRGTDAGYPCCFSGPQTTKASQMTTPLHLLILEDRASDAELMLAELREAGFEPDWKRVDSEADYIASLDPSLDLILADYHLPQFNGGRALSLLRERGLDIPFVLVSGAVDEETAVQMMRNGAADYVLKDRMKRLGQATIRALEEKRLRDEKRQAEETLRESEDKYRSLVERAKDGIVIIQDGVVKFANQRLAEMWGGMVEEVLGTPFTNFIHPDELPTIIERYQQRMAGKKVPPIYATVLLQKNGTKVYVELSAGVVNYLGKPADLVIVRDITERKRAADAQHAAEANYRALVEQIPAITYIDVADGSAHTLFVSPQITAILGVSQEEWMQGDMEFWEKLIHPDDQLRVITAYHKTIETGQSFDEEYRMFARDGRMVWIDDHAVLLENTAGRPRSIQGVMFDITARKEAEEALRESEVRYRAVVESQTELINRWRPDGTLTFVNDAYCRFYGRSREELIGSNWLALVAGEDHAHVGKYVERLLTTLNPANPTMTDEHRELAADGSIHWQQWTDRALFDEQGHLMEFQSIGRDITERKRAELERQVMLEIMQEVATTRDLQAAIQLIQNSISKVLYTEDFFVTFHNKATGMFEEVFAVDKYDEPMPPDKLEKSLTAYIFRTAEPLLLNQAQFRELEARGEVELVGTLFEAWLGVPLRTPTETVGVMAVQNYDDPNCYSERDKEFFAAVGAQVALALERKRAEEEIRQRNEDLALINAINAAVNRGESLAAIVGHISEEAQRIFNSQGATLFLFNETRDRLVMQNLTIPVALKTQIEKLIGDSIPSLALDPGAFPFGQVLESKQACLLTEPGQIQASIAAYIDSAPFSDKVRASLRKLVPGIAKLLGYRSHMVVPLISEGELIGALDMGSRSLFTKTDLHRMESIAGQLTAVIQRKRAQERLAGSESELRALFTAMMDVVIVYDEDGRYLKIAPTNPANLYLPQADMLGKTVHDILPNEKADYIVERIRASLQSGQVINAEYALQIGGKEIWFSASASPLSENMVVWVAHDITNRKRAEQTLKRQLQELTALQGVAAAGIQASSQDELIALVTRSVGATFYPDNFGVLLLDEAEKVLRPHPSYQGIFLADAPQFISLNQGLCGMTVTSGQPMRVGDVSKEAAYLPITPEICSELCVPIKIGGRVIGVLDAESIQVDFFSEADERLLVTIAGQMANALERLRLHTETVQRATQLATLNEVGRAVSTLLDIENIYQLVLEQLRRNLPLDVIYVSLYNPETKMLSFPFIYDEGKRYEENDSPLEITIYLGTVIETGDPLLVNRTPDEIAAEEAASGKHLRLGSDRVAASLMYAPLQVGSQVIGVISAQSYQLNAYTQNHLALFTGFANQTAIAIQNARLYQDALRAAERRAVLHRAGQELVRVSQDLEQVYAAAHQATAQLMPADVFTVALVDEEHGDVQAAYLFDNAGRWPSQRVPLGKGFSSRVMTSGEAILNNDLEKNPVEAVHFGTKDLVQSVLAVPMRSGEKVMGVISAQSYRKNAYGEDDRLLLEMLAAQTATAIQNARLFSEARRRVDQFAALYETAHDLADWQELPALLQTIVERERTLLHASDGAMYLFDPERQILSMEVLTDLTMPRVNLKLGEGLAGRVAQERKAMIVDDYRTWEGRTSQYDGVPISAVVDAPMLHGGELVGVLVAHEMGDTERKFNEEDMRLLSMFASQAASVVYNARLLAETRRRLLELEAVNRISTALRSTQNTEQMLPLLMDETLKLMNSDSGVIWLFDPASGLLKEHTPRGWFANIQEPPVRPGEGIAGSVFVSGQAILSTEFASDPRARQDARPQIPAGRGGACVPIRTERQTIGVIFIAAQPSRQINTDDVRLLTTITDMAGNAIRRAALYDQTERQLQRLAALRSVDAAIASSFDLRVTLDIALRQIVNQLHVDAADVLLFNPLMSTLEYNSGSGFRTDALQHTRLRLGESYAGMAGLERRLIHIPDLRQRKTDFLRSPNFGAEGFATCFCMPLITKGQLKGVLEVFQRTPMVEVEQEWREFLEMLAEQVAIAIDNSSLMTDLQRSNTELFMAYDATIEGWSKALDLRDKETEGHTQRVTTMTLELAQALQVATDKLIHVRRGALLHDIGKMGVPDEILRKPGSLSDEEWVVMRKHPTYAYEMLLPIAYLRPALEIPYSHHEKWDGSGYPLGLAREAIPLAARLFAVVDVYDALTSNRPYRAAWTHAQTLAYIREQSGRHFDPQVAEVFLQIQGMDHKSA
jgi:PAS domain S-box-containing protein